jgi:hypothetical protein
MVLGHLRRMHDDGWLLLPSCSVESGYTSFLEPIGARHSFHLRFRPILQFGRPRNITTSLEPWPVLFSVPVGNVSAFH